MFDSMRPNSLKDLLDIIYEKDCYKFAGGTDLYIRKRQWQGAERRFDKDVVFISHIDELRGIYKDKNFYKIKTCTTQDEVSNSLILPEYIKIPYSLMGNPAIRNTATVGGNIANAAQVADSLPVLYALDASIMLKSKERDRVIKVKDFIKGKYATDIMKNEIIYEVIIPDGEFNGYKYKKIGSRKASILSKLSVFIAYKKEGRELKDIRVSVGGINEVPVRSEEFEKIFLKNNDIDLFLTKFRELLKGKDDKRSTKKYREEVGLRVVKGFLEEIMERGA